MSKFFKVNKAKKEQKGTYVVYLDGAEWCTRNTKEEAEAVVNSYDGEKDCWYEFEKEASLKKKAEDIVPDKYRTILIDAIDNDTVDPKQIAKDLAQYMSEEMCEDFCRIYEIKDISELE